VEERSEEDDIEVHRLFPFGLHLVPLLERVAARVETKPAEVRLEGRRIVVETNGIKAEIETKPLKDNEAEFSLAENIEHTFALYKRRWACKSRLCPRASKWRGTWVLVVTTVERSAPSKLPIMVMLGVEPPNVHSGSDVKIYVLCLKDVHYYFTVKTREGQRAACEERYNRRVQINAETVVNAIKAIYSRAGVERRAEVRWSKDDTPYITLTKAVRSKTAVTSGDRKRLKVSTEGPRPPTSSAS